MAHNASELEVLERHMALPRRERVRIEKLMTAHERATLRQFRARMRNSSRLVEEEASPRPFLPHSPRMKLILTELVDERLKVKDGILAPAARASVQQWVDRLVEHPQSHVSQFSSVSGLADWLKDSLSQLGLFRTQKGQPL
ncbi:MAG: hypothetical protein RL145_234 [Pseudomonadota bacterium]|jgi:hypothetical protein